MRREREMGDAREALVALLHNEGDGGIWEHFDRKNSEAVADAILAKFDVTPRGKGTTIEIGGRRAGKTQAIAERVADEVMKRGGSATVTSLPSVEDVARALWELDEQEADATGGALDVPWSALDSLTQGLYRADAEDLLALLPGRTETEVKAEAWDEVADYLDRTNAPSIAEATRRDNPYRAGQ